MFLKKKSNDPVVLLKEKVDKLIGDFKAKNVPQVLNSHHRTEEDIEDFEDFLREHLLERYLNDVDKNACMSYDIEFSTMRYHNILKAISRGFDEFIKHKGQPSADDLVAQADSITAWRLFHLFYKDIL